MRVAWYTPYSNTSAIGLFSHEVINALLEAGHHVTLIRSERNKSETFSTTYKQICEIVPAYRFHDNAAQFLKPFDLVVYNIGNHFDNHYFALAHQKHRAGITLLHDFLLHHLAMQWASEEAGNSYPKLLFQEAGPDALQAYRAANSSAEEQNADWLLTRAIDFPVLRFAAPNTIGLVAHALFYQKIAQNLIQCPATTIPLAFPLSPYYRLPPPTLPNKAPCRLLTIGDVNKNKRVESIIKALGSSIQLSKQWQYRVIGSVSSSYKNKLLTLASQMAANVDLEILGKISEQQLQEEINASQAIACLRYPILEGASASALVSLASSRPTLISEGGCYREIPDELVYRVNQSAEIASIAEHIQAISDDYAKAIELGQKARQWVAERHSGKQYAEQLLKFWNDVRVQSPILQVADKIGGILAKWECPRDLSLATKAGDIIESLFTSHKSS